ncbi:MAG: KTSC domain-containing protein [Magnetococcales bacterium]|nr:KTSC domain-containing protein [Magnetococcales bacterium]
MNRVRVHSSNIRSVGHEPLSGVLEVEFCNGSIYQYSHVPEDVFLQLLNASSKGGFLAQRIKDHYSFRKVR